MKLLEQENGRLRKAVADLTIEKLVLTAAITERAKQHGRYGYRRITAWLAS